MINRIYFFFLSAILLCLFTGAVIYGQEKGDYDLSPFYDAAPAYQGVAADTTPSSSFPYPTVFNWHYSDMSSPWVSGGTVGAMFFDGKYILNTWGFASNPNKWYRYDGGLSGPTTFVDSNAYQGSIRDLATDGVFLYGSPISTTIHRMDANGISQGTITSGGGVVRAIAYSPDEDAFFVSDFSNNIGVINATTGALIRTLTGTSALTGKYGMGYSNIAGEGPVLWVWGQGTTASPYNNLWKVNPQTGVVIANYQFGPLPVSGTSLLGTAGGANVVQIGGRHILLLNYQNYALAGYDITEQIGPGPATNPNPAHNAGNVGINANLSWTNPSGAASIEVFFGTAPGSLNSVYSGPPVSTWDPGTLAYFTQYYWRVNATDASGTSIGDIWSFRTEFAPGVGTLSANPGPANNGVSANAAILFNLIADPMYDVEIFQMTTASNAVANANFNVEIFTREGTALGGPVGSGPGSSSIGWTSLGTAPVTQGAVGSGISLPFAIPSILVNAGDTVGVAVRFTGAGPRYFGTGSPPYGNYSNAHLTLITGDVRSIPFGTTGSWFASRELVGEVYYSATIIPVELVSFTASIIDSDVQLNWITATETNNMGFEIQRTSHNPSINNKEKPDDWQMISFVAGNGTTTELQNYFYTDKNPAKGEYKYRLKQIDFDGSFSYSGEVEVSIGLPDNFSLSQNYPNPFNPATKIKYAISSNQNVVLKVFDILGNEIATLVNEAKEPGEYEIDFDGSSLSSGIYFYNLSAGSFNQVRKMALIK
jgi:hypothetical protein